MEKVKEEIGLLDKFISINEEIHSHFNTHKDKRPKFSADGLKQAKQILEKLLESEFFNLKKNNQQLVLELKNFTITQIKKEKGNILFPQLIGQSLTNFFKNSDFTGFFWCFLQFLFKIIENFLRNPDCCINNHIFEYRLQNLSKIINLLKMVLAIKNINHFALNYIFLMIFSYVSSIDPTLSTQEEFDASNARLCVLFNECLSEVEQNLNSKNWPEDYKIIIDKLFEVFPKIKLGKNFFLFWHKLAAVKCDIFCQINYPDKKDFHEKDILETNQTITSMLDIFPNSIYAFATGSIGDTAITLPNCNIGFKNYIIYEAQKSYKGKLFILMAGTHELAHWKGIISYKKSNYFLNSPEKLQYEAGNYCQENIFNGRIFLCSMKDDEKLYESTLFSVMSTEDNLPDIKDRFKSLLNIDNFMKAKSLTSSLLKNYGSYDEKKCFYSSVRDIIVHGLSNYFLDDS